MKRLDSIEIGRGIAALLVVCFHATGIVGAGKYIGEVPLNGIFNFGYAGVDFFFVLSGFIIYISTENARHGTTHVVRYLKRRLIRIYPIYWIVAAAALPFFLLLSHSAQAVNGIDILKDLALFPREQKPFLGVAWTLRHEMLFYFSFLLFFVNQRVAWAYFSAWGLLIAAKHAFLWEVSSPELNFYLDLHNTEFIFGMVVAWLVIKMDWKTPSWCLPAGLTVLASGAIYELIIYKEISELPPDFHAIFGIASMFIVLGIATTQPDTGNLFVRAAIFLGRSSYSIYLIHYLILSFSMKLIMSLGAGKTTSFLLLITLGLSAGILLHQTVERKLLHSLHLKFGLTEKIKT